MLEAGLMVDPLSAYLHSRGGNIYTEMEQYEEARRMYERALELDPRDPGTYARLSDLAFETNDIPGMLRWQKASIEVDPQDHELVATLAGDFYNLGLVEEGDRWTQRMMALSPDSDVSRMVQVQRSVAREEPDQAKALAAQMISDGATNRQGALLTAAITYSGLMARQGLYQEGFDFLVAANSQVGDFDAMPTSPESMILRWTGITMMGPISAPGAQAAAWEQLINFIDQTGFPWRDNPYNVMTDQIMRGDLAAAIDTALNEDLSQPLSKVLGYEQFYSSPFFADVAADPRVQSRLAELDRQKMLARQEVESMLLEPEWSE